MKKIKRYPLQKMQDVRGWLVQSEHKEIASKMKYFLVSFSKSNAIRGNHYHKRKQEWFSILQGKVRLYLYDLKTKEKGEYIISSEKMEFVEMAPNVVHAIKNIGNQELIFFEVLDEPFNAQDPDTFPYKLI